MRYIFALSLTLLSGLLMEAQPLPNQVYYIVHLPAKAHYRTDQLNNELAHLSRQDEVIHLIKTKNFPPLQIVFLVRPDQTHISWWPYNTSDPPQRQRTDEIILQSKGDLDFVLNRPADFNLLLRNTIAIIDTLRISVSFKDKQYPPDQYSLANTKIRSEKANLIPYSDGQLILTAHNFRSYGAAVNGPYRIANTAVSGEYLASFSITLITAEQKQLFQDQAGILRKAFPDISIKDMARYIKSYCDAEIGTIFYSALVDWLSKNLL